MTTQKDVFALLTQGVSGKSKIIRPDLKGPESDASSASSESEEAFSAREYTASERERVLRAAREAAEEVQGEYGITVNGVTAAPLTSFEDMACVYQWPVWLQRNVAQFGFTGPTAIQMAAIPILHGDDDLFAYSETGSGKSLAFLLPVIAQLRLASPDGVRAVILLPSHELAEQVYNVVLRLTKGEKSWRTLWLQKGRAIPKTLDPCPFDVCVSTPSVLAVAVQKGLALDKVQHVVFDEADRLFDQIQDSFLGQIDKILSACTNPKRRCWLFSATRDEAAEEIASRVLQEPLRLMVGTPNRALASVEQSMVYTSDEKGKLLGLWQLIRGGVSTPMLVFVQSQVRAQDLAREVRLGGVSCAAMHGGTSVGERERLVAEFRAGKLFVLVATDLLARGIDYSAVKVVLNYDMPQTRNSYIHRIGRTGRAGRKGKAITFCTTGDRFALRAIARVMKESGNDVPDWLINMPKPTKRRRDGLARRPIARDPVSAGRILSTPLEDEDKQPKKTMRTEGLGVIESTLNAIESDNEQSE